MQLSLKLAAITMRWALRGVAALLAVLLLAAAVLHWGIVPRIDEFRPRLERLASRAVDAPVTIGAIEADANGLVPSVSLRDVRVHDPTGRAGLRVPRVGVAFSVLSLGRGGIEQLVIDQPELELRRTAAGRLLVGGIDLSGDASGDTAAADWFFSQPEVVVRGGSVRWVDERRDASAVQLSDVQFVARNGYGRHQLRLDATPEAAWGERFTLIGRFRQPVFSRRAGVWREWDGQAYADFARVDVSRLRQYADLKTDWGVDVQSGRGALRLWADVQRGLLTGATADVALGAVAVRLGPQLPPLGFASLTGRLGWRNPGAGMELSTRDLHFVDADGLAWPGGNLRLSYRDGADGLPAGGEFNGDRLDLGALAKIAARLPLPPAVHQRLTEHPVQGLVERISARWDGPPEAPRDWRLNTRVSGLSVAPRPAPAPARAGAAPAEGVPGVEGALLELQATPAGGQATLDIRDGALAFPGVFAEPRIPLAELALKSRWRVQDGQITLDVDELALRNADAAGSFKARWQSVAGQQGAERFPGRLELSGSFSRANGARIHRYLPLGIPASARDYVRAAVHKGEARNVAVRVKGDLREIGSRQPAPGTEFRFAGQVRGVTLAYVPRALQPEDQPPWPPLEDLAGELVFEHNSMQVKNASARVQGHPGWQFTRMQAGIADLGRARVLIDAEGRGTLASALGVVQASPVSGFIQHALDRASASGNANLRLKLDLPIERIQDARIDGRATLAGNELRITPDAPALTQAHGVVSFSDTGFTLQDARARLLGGEARLSGGTQSSAAGGAPVLLRASGSASAAGLREMADWAPLPAVARHASGSAAYEAQIGFRAGEPEVLVTSDLRGMTIELPAPLAKPADTAWPLRYESGPVAGAAGRSRFRVAVADQLAVEYERDAASGRVLRGVIGVGAQAQPQLALPASGVLARLHLARLEADAWQDTLARLFGSADAGGEPAPGDSGFVPTVWSLRTPELVLDERTVHDVTASGTREGRTWRADVQARELAGRVEYSEGVAGRAGKVLARLSRLSIAASGAGEDESVLAQPPANMPALDVEVQDFELRGKPLGRLEIEAINHDVASPRTAGALQEWELKHLNIRAPEATFTASGRWATQARGPALPLNPRAARAQDDARRTALDFRLDVRDAGKLLARFDMPGVLARGKGAIEGTLGWRGAPLSPHYPSMDGQLRVDMGAGQFLKADPGVAKLLGVLSLQALPRRLTLDFRDLFSAGFAFDFVRGDVEVARGIATTRNLQMKGASAAVLMDGNADIDRESTNLRVLVVPEIDAGTAALVATAINPAIGIGAFVAQLVLKQPLIKAATREFHVGGQWDDPQVTAVGARGARAAPAPAPGASEPPASKENS